MIACAVSLYNPCIRLMHQTHLCSLVCRVVHLKQRSQVNSPALTFCPIWSQIDAALASSNLWSSASNLMCSYEWPSHERDTRREAWCMTAWCTIRPMPKHARRWRDYVRLIKMVTINERCFHVNWVVLHTTTFYRILWVHAWLSNPSIVYENEKCYVKSFVPMWD